MVVDGEQLALDHLGLVGPVQPDGDVGLAHGKVELGVVEFDFELDGGIERHEFVDALGEPGGAETHGRGDEQGAGRHVLALGHLRLDRLQLPGHAMGGAEELFAHLGQNEAARVADEELEPEIFLERGNLAGNGRLGHAELFSGMGKAPRFGGDVKYTQLVPVQHFPRRPLFAIPFAGHIPASGYLLGM